MVDKLVDRKERINQAMSGNLPKSGMNISNNDRVVSDETLFNQLGKKIKRVK